MKKQEYIYRVSIKDEPAGNNIWTTDYYFTSLSAIYEQLTPEQIGCKVENLWNLKISTDKPYFGRKCTITKEPFMRMKHKSAPISPDNLTCDNLHENKSKR